MLTSIWYMGSPFGDDGMRYTAATTLIYFAYNIGSFIVASRRLVEPGQLVVATAVLDSLMLSAWLVLTGAAAPLFTCFYIFTIFGYGFRIGTRAMWINQLASLAGFLCTMSFSRFWQENLLASASVLVLLIAVPVYATILIRKLLDARALAEYESQAKSQLLANVSHELRTPLNGIVATAQIMKCESGSRKVTEQAETILELSRNLLLEINELLDSAKYRAQSIRPVKEPVDLNRLAERLRMTLLQSAQTKGIKLTVTVDSRIEDAIRSDEHHLLRVLMNIAGNAVKFTDQGKVSIHFILLDKTPDQYRIRFSVEDTGIGIAPEEQKKIFEPFYQVSSESSPRLPGTGLGMSIARDIVGMLGSCIELESRVGTGSMFYFDIALDRVAKAAMRKDQRRNIPAIEGKRILVVEDHPLNLMLARKILEIDRHAVVSAANGVEAIESMGRQEFDMVFLDYNLGDMSGIDVMRAYFRSVGKPAPVYFLTADATDATRDALTTAGASGVLHKPVILQHIRQAISNHCLPGFPKIDAKELRLRPAALTEGSLS